MTILKLCLGLHSGLRRRNLQQVEWLPERLLISFLRPSEVDSDALPHGQVAPFSLQEWELFLYLLSGKNVKAVSCGIVSRYDFTEPYHESL